jgi:hypothetical protein
MLFDECMGENVGAVSPLLTFKFPFDSIGFGCSCVSSPILISSTVFGPRLYLSFLPLLRCLDIFPTFLSNSLKITRSSSHSIWLGLIPVGIFAPLCVSVPRHTLTIMKADGSPIKPVRVRDLAIRLAQRHSGEFSFFVLSFVVPRYGFGYHSYLQKFVLKDKNPG